jgi:hypothetical protein
MISTDATLMDVLAYVRAVLDAYASGSVANTLVQHVTHQPSYEDIDSAGEGRHVYGWLGTAGRMKKSDGARIWTTNVPVYVRCVACGPAQTVEYEVQAMAYDVMELLMRTTDPIPNTSKSVRKILRIENIYGVVLFKGKADLLIEISAQPTIQID